MADQDNPHFTKIFWYIVFTTTLVFAYCVAVSFYPIPTQNTRVVDTITGFLLGTILSAGVGYLLGGNPIISRKPANTDSTDVRQMNVDAENVNLKENGNS